MVYVYAIILTYRYCWFLIVMTVVFWQLLPPLPARDSNFNVILNVQDLFENYDVQHVNSNILLKNGLIINTRISRDFEFFLNRIYLTILSGNFVNYDINLILFWLLLFRWTIWPMGLMFLPPLHKHYPASYCIDIICNQWLFWMWQLLFYAEISTETYKKGFQRTLFKAVM